MSDINDAMRRAAAVAESEWINCPIPEGENEWPSVLKAALASLAADGFVLVDRNAVMVAYNHLDDRASCYSLARSSLVCLS